MNEVNHTRVEEKYAEYWKSFRFFPLKWVNALYPHGIYILFMVSYLLFWGGAIWRGYELSSQMRNMRFLIGLVFIGFAEVHILALSLLLVIWAYIRWIRLIPNIFEWLRQPPRRLSLNSGDFDNSYLDYLHEYQQNVLTKKYSTIYSLSVIVTLLLFLLIIYKDYFILKDIFLYIPLLLMLLFPLFWGYFMGLGAWPVFVTMKYIKKLTLAYEVNIQPSHPDKCGGLEPLGGFCFAMSLPILIGGLALSIVSVFGLSLYFSGVGNKLYSNFNLNFSFNPIVAYASILILILFAMPLITITFFLPLWDIHNVMKKNKRKAQDDYASRIMLLEQDIRSQIDLEGGLKEATKSRDKLVIIKETINPNIIGYPVWPFRPNILFTLFSPQIISIAGFLLSVYKTLFP